MINKEQAKQKILKIIKTFNTSLPDDDEFIILDEYTIEKEWGWVFCYTSKKWHEENDYKYAVAGNAPFIVEKLTGKVLDTGTAHRLEYYIENYEKSGDPHKTPSSKLKVIESNNITNVEDAIRSIRKYSSLTIMEAKKIVNDAFNGNTNVIEAKDINNASILMKELSDNYFIIERIYE